MKTLVTFFSVGGTTAAIAKKFAETNGFDIFEVVPVEPYTAADIKWTNPFARCNKEKIKKKDVPVQGKIAGFDAYDTIFIGFPIWYYAAPNVINTFCKDYNWTGKKIIAFATSGGSPIGKTADKLKPYVNGASSVEAVLVKSERDLEKFL